MESKFFAISISTCKLATKYGDGLIFKLVFQERSLVGSGAIQRQQGQSGIISR